MKMELEGRLNSTISLPEVLQFLGSSKLTGSLAIVQGDYSASLVIRQGRLANSSSMGRPRRLGHMLVSRGLIERAAVEEALAYQQDFSPSTPLGRILVHRGHITNDQLRQAIRLQLEEELWELFALKDGSFKFEPSTDETFGSDALVEIEIEPLILEGTRRMDEWVRIVKNIPGDHAVPSVMPLEDSTDRESMHFSDAEWSVLSLINGHYDVGCIAARSGIGKFETFRIINSFLASGMAKIAIPREAAPEAFSLDKAIPVSTEYGNGKAAHDKAPSTGGSSAYLSALFARWRDTETGAINLEQPQAARQRGQLNFPSPVSFVAALCNGILDELMGNPDFIVDPRDERLAERYWQPIVMDLPRSDLLTAKGNIIEAAVFERYIESAGVNGPLKSVYIDTMEALSRYLRTLYIIAGQRLGSKAAKKIFASLLEDYRQRSKVGNSEEFFFNEYAARALE